MARPISLPKAYEPRDFEDKAYAAWERSGFFNPDNLNPDGAPFTIVLPPPNATGTLHLGHAVMLALQDLMIRYHRIKGERALWIPGTDHASIATQNKVEKLLAKEGISRHDLGRDAFLEKVNAFVEESRGTIRSQVRKMGSSCDWSRERYTLDAQSTHAVREAFVRMYNDGLIYRGVRMVNWCPRCESTLADDEVEHSERAGKLYHITYPVKGSNETLTVATTRPETMLGDSAIAVNPNDARYKHLVGGVAILPTGNREIPIIADDYVEMNFGTGALKVTPAHDINDFTLGQKYGLKTIPVINEQGNITLEHLQKEMVDLESLKVYEGMERHEAREAIIKDLSARGLVPSIEDIVHSVGVCYRCKTVVEPLLSLQWFIDVNKEAPSLGSSLKAVSLRVVEEKEITIIPARFEKQYFHWMNNLRDWCISRQIWFGHRIPVTYCEKAQGGCGNTIVSVQDPHECPQCHNTILTPEGDTLDTWFSSGLWTVSTLGWPDAVEEKNGTITKKGDLATYHPTNVLETGYDILFFWVARMILMTEYVLHEVPFKNVYLHGLVLDKEGKKMSKTKEETIIDPLDMIEQYGTDAVRLSMIVGVTPGNDVRLYQEKIEGFRNLVNKLWNIGRFVLEFSATDEKPVSEYLTVADEWIIARLNATISSINTALENYEFSLAAETLRAFTWDDFADWYIEVAKIEGGKGSLLRSILRSTLALWHPFAPFVSEVLYQELRLTGDDNDTSQMPPFLMIEQWPTTHTLDTDERARQFEVIRGVVGAIRNARAELNIPAGNKISATLYAPYHRELLEAHRGILERLCRLENITIQEQGEQPKEAIALKYEKVEIYIPLSAEKKQEELVRIKKELEEITALSRVIGERLANEEFSKKAPSHIVETDQRKHAEYLSRMAKLKEQQSHLE